MKKNIGTVDRIIRFVLGVVLIILAFTVVKSTVGMVLLILAGLFCFYQALTSWCLLYQLMGKNTCPVE